MSQRITITLPDDVVTPLSEIARAQGQTLEEFAAEKLASSVSHAQPLAAESARRAEERFARWIGSVSLGHQTGSDNETIDADLAREYTSTHENGE
jgi:predicted transcriptional regulator